LFNKIKWRAVFTIILRETGAPSKKPNSEVPIPASSPDKVAQFTGICVHKDKFVAFCGADGIYNALKEALEDTGFNVSL